MDILLLLLLTTCVSPSWSNIEEEKYGVKFATNCEVCKLVTKEIAGKLLETYSSDVIETGYNVDGTKKRTSYKKSELRLLETLEGICEGMLKYRIHKERTDSTRWAKMMSQTFKTLHGLVNKGVKVDLGIPYDLWDDPSAEVAELKTQCEHFLEENEDAIADWYFGKQDEPLQEYLCPGILEERACLSEPYGESIGSDSETTSSYTKDSSKDSINKIPSEVPQKEL